jgi:hypothetical protein
MPYINGERLSFFAHQIGYKFHTSRTFNRIEEGAVEGEGWDKRYMRSLVGKDGRG